jgi:hypothetical protein
VRSLIPFNVIFQASDNICLLAFFQFVQHLIESEVNDVVMVKLVGRD